MNHYKLHIELIPIDVKEGSKESKEALDIDKESPDYNICVTDNPNPLVRINTDDKGFHFAVQNGWCVKEVVGLKNGGIEMMLKKDLLCKKPYPFFKPSLTEEQFAALEEAIEKEGGFEALEEAAIENHKENVRRIFEADGKNIEKYRENEERERRSKST